MRTRDLYHTNIYISHHLTRVSYREREENKGEAWEKEAYTRIASNHAYYPQANTVQHDN